MQHKSIIIGPDDDFPQLQCGNIEILKHEKETQTNNTYQCCCGCRVFDIRGCECGCGFQKAHIRGCGCFESYLNLH